MAEVHLVSPVIVKLKPEVAEKIGTTPDALGHGIIVGGAIYHDFATDEAGQIKRDGANQPIMEKKRDMLVVWENDKSNFFTHQMSELEPIEVVAIRTLEEMKQEVIQACLAEIDSDERIEEVADLVVDKLAEEEGDGGGEPAPEAQTATKS